MLKWYKSLITKTLDVVEDESTKYIILVAINVYYRYQCTRY